jgi:hypothetical protein
MTRWSALAAPFFAAVRPKKKTAEPDAPQDPDGEDPVIKGIQADMEAMRDHLRRVGTALGVAGGALLGGLGYAQVHKLFPIPIDSSRWILIGAIAAAAAALVGAAWLAGRFYGAQRRIPVRTEEDEPQLKWLRKWRRTPSGLWPGESEIRHRIYDETARDDSATSLKALELRQLRFERLARRAKGKRETKLKDDSERIKGIVSRTLFQAAAAILERRAHQAFSGWLTRFAFLLTIAGIIGVFGLADWSQGQRDLVALGKQCGEAKTPIAACKHFGAVADRDTTATTAADDAKGWLNGYTETVLQTPTTEYRVYGGGSDRIGTWVTPSRPANGTKARAVLALPDENAAQCTVRVDIPAGAKIRIGHVGPLFHHPGGAAQLKIMSSLDGVVFSADTALPPSSGPCP